MKVDTICCCRISTISSWIHNGCESCSLRGGWSLLILRWYFRWTHLTIHCALMPTCRVWLSLPPLFSAYPLLGIYSLTTYTYQCMRLLTQSLRYLLILYAVSPVEKSAIISKLHCYWSSTCTLIHLVRCAQFQIWRITSLINIPCDLPLQQ